MRLHKIVSNTRPAVSAVGKYRLVTVHHLSTLHTIKDQDFDGLIVDSEDVLKATLQHDQFYLKPTFYIGTTSRQCDGEVADASDPQIARRLDVLVPQVETYNGLTLPDAPDERLLTKLIRYLHTRSIDLQARRSRHNSIGYTFPLVEDMSIERDSLRIIKHLDDYTGQGHLSADPIDKINVCYDCNASYLNFSECCTKCNSLDLTTEELIHHFRCAYVGPQSDFVKEEKLICPKCDHQLKHIGIDYDKPSEIHTCKSCNHSSQETKMKARCIDCGKENELEQLTTHTISNYRITEKARSYAAQEVSTPSFGQTTTSTNSAITSIAAYTLIKSHESRKNKTTHTDTHDMIISVAASLLAQLNAGMQSSLVEELAMIVHPYLQANDLIAIDENLHIRLLLVDYQQESADQLLEVLSYNLNKMLRDNGWGSSDAITLSLQSIRS